MYRIIEFNNEEQHVNDFLNLPRKLYGKKTTMQNYEEEKAILSNAHILSKYFKLHKYLVYLEDEAVARCVLTIYPDDKEIYIGYFESINDKETAKLLFDEVNKFAISNNYDSVIGPVDCSFWIGYRLKTNCFDKLPYVGEPYNKDYYLELFSQNGYYVSEEYVSHFFKKLPLFNKKFNTDKKKYEDRYKEFKDKGYKIVSPSKKDFDKVINEVYSMIMELYKDFPIFKHISLEDYKKYFKSLEQVLDYSMVKLAYHNGQAVGFLMGLPDYKNMLCGKITTATALKIFLKKIRCSNYVMLYMGVKEEHRGLGKAMVRTIFKNVYLKFATVITAFTKEGRKTKEYGENFIDNVYEYVLLKKEIEKNG